MRINKILLNFMLFVGFVLTVQGQNQNKEKDSASVHAVILTLFDGMREADSAKVSSVFHKEVRMYSSFTSKEGKLMLKAGKLSSFLNAIGTPHDKIWDEKIWNTKIVIDGGIAQVWTDYAFYISDDFSHCGVDAFDLVKDSLGNWKIIHLMDTRKKEGCETGH